MTIDGLHDYQPHPTAPRNSNGHLLTSSRRTFLQGAAALAAAHAVFTAAPLFAGAPAAEEFAYVGTYSGALGKGGNGEGIYLYKRNTATGELTLVKLAAAAANPSCLALHPSRKYLYAGNEVTDYAGSRGKGGSVSAYLIDAATGELKLLNVVSSEGSGPAYISLDSTGKFVFVANYQDGSVAVLPILEGGSLGAATDTRADAGDIGASKAASEPAGSFANSGHDGPHAHMIEASPDNRFVLYTDLGQDRIYVSRFDAQTGKLTPAAKPYASLPTGEGPRHFAFHPNGKWLYSIQEEASTLAFFHYDASTGELVAEQSISSLPPGFQGTSYTSEVMVSPDGKFLYAANRLHDSVAVFSIDAAGRLAFVGESSTLGDYPAAFNIAPGGSFLYACNLHSDAIACFRINKKTGLLTFTGNYTGVGSPGSIVFMG